MPAKPLSAATRAKLNKASPAAVEAAAARLSPYLRRDRWLGTRNRYLRQTVKTVSSDSKVPGSAIPKHLSEYVAASAVLHCADGWSYLGRALAAHCRGDAAVARHLAYYAELRAGLGLLATQGIGIFATQNVVIQGPGAIDFFHGGTHPTTWQALELWSDSPAGAALLSTVVRPGRSPLSDWVVGLGLGTGAWSPLGREWLRAWGLDLRMFGRDRDIRNEASYRPTTLRSASRTPQTDASFVQELWPLFEPAPGDAFRQLDRHILRLTLERAFESIVGRPSSGDPDFERALDRTLRANAGVGIGAPLGQFLSRAVDSNTPRLFVAAATRASHLDASYHVHVASRAALLLRAASGASLDLLQQARVEAGEYRFWSEQFAESHGVCEIGALPVDPADLWADVDEAIVDLSESLARGAGRSFFALVTEAATAIEVLTGCERVAVWGLAA